MSGIQRVKRYDKVKEDYIYYKSKYDLLEIRKMITIVQLLPRYNSISIDGLHRLISLVSLIVVGYKKKSVLHIDLNILVFVTYEFNL